jgi:prepilin signal peptidase PulO-like enzyme (type II secretory pathway)
VQRTSAKLLIHFDTDSKNNDMPLFLPIALFLVGSILGAAANFLIYRQRIEPRPISPWMKNEGTAPRQWFDFVPIFGWLNQRRHAAVFGTGFWIRPLLVELLMGLGTVALYGYEMKGGLLPQGFPPPVEIIYYQFAAHVALIFFMLVASLIDADETIIPDSITISGTLTGLAVAACFPQSLLPEVILNGLGVLQADFLRFTSPNDWPKWADLWGGLSLGLGCWLFWCFALLPRSWYVRHGVRRAIGLCAARICREAFSYWILGLALAGMAVLAIGWNIGGMHWAGLLTSLVGLAAGGATVWTVRILGSAALKREAMGFGDVTLMAMIGSFVGWQACLIVFFLAPFAALAVGVFRLLFTREREIPYGPFLCLATLGTILYWEPIWAETWQIFSLGWLVPLVLAVCFALMPILLYGIRFVGQGFQLLFPREDAK